MTKPAKILSFALVLVLLVSLATVFALPSSAATSSSVTSTLRQILPVITYASPLSGASKVYAYSDASLRTPQYAYYINAYTEQIVIREITNDGKAVSVTYPCAAGYRTKWFRTDDILGLSAVKTGTFKANSAMTVYRKSSAYNVRNYGTISKNSYDTCYQLGTHVFSGKTYYSTAYKLSSATWLYGISIRHKLGLTASSGVKTTTTTKSHSVILNPTRISLNYSSLYLTEHCKQATIKASIYPSRATTTITWTTSNPNVATVSSGKVTAVGNGTAIITARTANGLSATTSVVVKAFSLMHPMKDYTTKYTQWAIFPSYTRNSSRTHHCGVDYYSYSDSNVYAIASGTVVDADYNKANGYYVTIKHVISGKAVYSFYAHLENYCVKTGSQVTTGAKIGTVGKTGLSANEVTHLHFALVDKFCPGGGYLGYVSAFSGDKVTYRYYGVDYTFYNPYYVISYQRLP